MDKEEKFESEFIDVEFQFLDPSPEHYALVKTHMSQLFSEEFFGN